MLSVFVPSETSLKKVAPADLVALPENAVWIDLVKPTPAEDHAVERLAGIAVPTREDMQEIEISSRLYIENGARYMTATLMCAADTQNPRTTAVTFILSSHRLVTVRYDEPKPFMLVENKLARSCAPGVTGETVLMELLDAVIDRNADILERAGSDMDTISHEIFEPKGAARTGHAKRYSDILIAIGRKGDLTSKVRESLVSIGRVVTFVAAGTEGVKWSKDMREQLKTMQRDVVSLTDHASYLSNKITFVLDAMLGVVNLEQNNGGGVDAADLDRLDLRHEFQADAGTGMDSRLSFRAGGDAARRRAALSVFHLEKVVVRVDGFLNLVPPAR